jgi:hypothetical protein
MTRTETLELSETPALSDAVDRVRELSVRLWAVRAAHAPVRGLLGRLRCGTCGEPHPCTTQRVASGMPVRRAG